MATRTPFYAHRPPLTTTGHLFATRPWHSDGISGGNLNQIGELLTLTLADNSALRVHYPFPRHSTRGNSSSVSPIVSRTLE